MEISARIVLKCEETLPHVVKPSLLPHGGEAATDGVSGGPGESLHLNPSLHILNWSLVLCNSLFQRKKRNQKRSESEGR